MSSLLVFAYGSLAARRSASLTLGAEVEVAGPARLRGWARRWTTARDNLASEKTFAPAAGGEPFGHCLGLNIEPDAGAPPPNGALLRLGEAQLERLDMRELRYSRVEVTELIEGPVPPGATVIAYAARPEHHRPAPPRRSVILAEYVRAVERAFAELGSGQLDAYRESTDPPPVDVVEGVLVAGRVPAGNPTAW